MKRALVLVDHGSRRAEANEVVERIAERIRALEPGLSVRSAHMELASPSLGEAIGACLAAGERDIVVHPYFLGPGRHTREDIPALIREAIEGQAGVRVQLSEPLGDHEKLAELVLERVGDASPFEPN